MVQQTDGTDLRPAIDFHPIVDAFPDLVWAMDARGHCQFANRRWRDYTGQSPADTIGLGWQAAIHWSDLERVRSSWEGDGDGIAVDIGLRRHDGIYSRFTVTRTRLPDNEVEGISWCGTARPSDATARAIIDLKRAETLLEGEVRVLEMVALGRPLRAVLDALSRLVEEISSDCLCSILLVSPDRSHFRVGAGPSLPDEYNRILDGKTIDGGYGPCSLSVLRKEPVITADLANDPRWAGSVWPPLMKAYGYASCWSMPIMSGSGEVSGIFALYRRDPVSPTAAEQQLVDRFTKIAEIAINRSLADDALRESEARLLRTLAQLEQGQRLSKTGSFTADIQADTHQWSAEFYRIFDIDPAERPSLKAVRERIHPDDLELYGREIQRGVDGGNSDFIFRVVTREGEVRHLRGVAKIIERRDGRPIFMGTVQDITESTLAAAALLASESDLRRANAYLTEAQRLSLTGSFTWDVQADEHNWSEQIYRTFGFDPATKVTMSTIQRAVHPDDMAEVERVIGGAFEGKDFDIVFRIVTPAGEVRHAHVVGHRMEYISDRPVFVGALRDVTEQRRREEALEKARAELAHVARVTTLSALTASIAHEVSQPLSGILTNANTSLRMLASDPPDLDGAAAGVRRAIRDTDRATEVVKRLRALFARRPAAIEAVDVNEITSDVITLTAAELSRQRVIVQTDLDRDLPPASGDRVQLQQVILNLVLNAGEAMATINDRPRRLLVRTHTEAGGLISLSVEDAGPGFERGAAEKLFESFYTTKEGGMGVGLSISRSIIENHGGRIWAAANEAGGATFSFAIPGTSAR